MPPSDQEPRYQLVDSNGNVVGSLFGDGSGNVVIADETDTQTTFGPDGITTPALKAERLNNVEVVASWAHSSVSDAIAALPTDGGIVEIAEDHTETTTISNDGKTVVIKGRSAGRGGQGNAATTLYADLGITADFIVFDSADFCAISKLNIENTNNMRDAVAFESGVQHWMQNCQIRDPTRYGVRHTDSFSCTLYGVDVDGAGADGFRAEYANGLDYRTCTAKNGSRHGFSFDRSAASPVNKSGKGYFIGDNCFATNNDGHGVFAKGVQVLNLDGFRTETNDTDNSGEDSIQLTSDANNNPCNVVRIVGCHLQTANAVNAINASDAKLVNIKDNFATGHDFFVKTGSNSEDVDIGSGNNYSNVTSLIDAFGTRDRFDSVIGGGPLGGVDLSSVNGKRDGDLAVADGTSSANAGDLAKWDDQNTQWDVFQPATTV